ncbi:MAG: hypothetical protein FWE23_08610 [Chitinivibrionia bacterium]|nr:hypothetical protein [Chitinivibrionia bacterium]
MFRDFWNMLLDLLFMFIYGFVDVISSTVVIVILVLATAIIVPILLVVKKSRKNKVKD